MLVTNTGYTYNEVDMAIVNQAHRETESDRHPQLTCSWTRWWANKMRKQAHDEKTVKYKKQQK